MKNNILLLSVLGAFAMNSQAQSSEPYLHVATPDNTGGNSTKIEKSELIGNNSTILMVTHNHSPVGGKVKIHDKKIGVYYTGNYWRIFNQDKSTMDTNVAFNVLIPGIDVKAYVHTADTSNIVLNYTILDHGAINDNPNALVFVTDVWKSVYNTNPIGVYYNTIQKKWCIFHQKSSVPMVKNSLYNIIFPESKTGFTKFVHRATTGNTTKERTYLDHPDANNNPEAKIFITQNWNPNGALTGVYNNHNVGVFYDGSKWVIFNEDLVDLDTGASFNVMVFSDKQASINKSEMNKQVNLFPNPVASGEPLEIQLTNPLKGNLALEIFDMSGKLIKKQGSDKSEYIWNGTITTDGLKRGVYILKISGLDYNSTQRFIIE